jgi:hypothetical protein
VISRKVLWVFVATCGSVIVAAAPTMTQAADGPVSEQATALSTKQDELVCQTVDRPGSHMKQRICAPSAEWSAARGRLSLLRNNPAAGVGPTGDQNISTAATGFSFQR